MTTKNEEIKHHVHPKKTKDKQKKLPYLRKQSTLRFGTPFTTFGHEMEWVLFL